MPGREAKTHLESKAIGALPVANHFIERLHIREILTRFVKAKSRRGRPATVGHVDALLVLLRNLVVHKLALYRIPEWAGEHVPELFAMRESELRRLNDEHLARALDILYEADRRDLVTQVTVQAVRNFKVELREIHNDTTTISFFGKYENQDFLGTVLLCRGFNKDHRPDLKQLVFSVCASADGDVPVHFGLFDGNKHDEHVHCGVWNDLRDFIGHSDFIYVADCKLCTRVNMFHIDSRQGKFITVMPRSRKEDGEFRDWVQSNEIPWTEETRLENSRDRDGPPHVFKVYEADRRSQEGYRIIWVWDSLKAVHDALKRKENTDDAVKALKELAGKIGRRNLKTREQVQTAAAKVLLECHAGAYLTVHVDVVMGSKYKQARPGRPAQTTPYIRRPEEIVTLSWRENTEYIRWESKTDGLFPLITNIERDGSTRVKSKRERQKEGLEVEDLFPPLRILEIYKRQPNVEKLHSVLKSWIRAMPVWLKKVQRIEALLMLAYLALLICNTMQRELRRRMAKAGIDSLPLYPDEKECERPTARVILELFEAQRRHRLFRGGTLEQTFWDNLSPLQAQVLDLLSVDPAGYGRTSPRRHK
jgi:transposase